MVLQFIQRKLPRVSVRRAESFKGHSHKSRSPPSLLFALWLRCVRHRRASAPFLMGGPFGLPFWQQNRAVSFAWNGDPCLILSKHPPTPIPLLLRLLLAEVAGHGAGRVGVPEPPCPQAEGSHTGCGRRRANCFTPRGKRMSPASSAAS